MAPENKEICRLTGRVEHGRGLGRRLGFPTANIVLRGEPPELPHGVYAAMIELPDGVSYPAVTNLGVRPTVESEGALWAESHLIGFSGDLYGLELTVALCEYLRPELRFDSIEALRGEITRNVEQAKRLLAQ